MQFINITILCGRLASASAAAAADVVKDETGAGNICREITPDSDIIIQ